MNVKQALSCLLLCICFLACKRKDELFTTDPNARLSFSIASVQYDTVFSELSYATKRIKVFNGNNQALSIDEVALVAGSSSPFTILVNGQKGPAISGLELMGGDSMLIIVDLHFNAKDQATPYRLEDQIRFRFNGQEQYIALSAVGQDALAIPSGDLPCGQVWDKQKAIILLGQTTVPAGCTLTVEKGSQILGAIGSSLDIKGTLILRGDALEPIYVGSVASGQAPGRWLGIRFYEGSSHHELSWFTLANAQSGLSFASSSASSFVDISMDHAVFKDFTLHALDLSFVALQASNCLFIASANHLTQFSKQGMFDFRHCTWAGYSSEYFREGTCIHTTAVAGTLSVSINHAIVWGDKVNEFSLDPTSSFTIDTSLAKTNLSLAGQGQILNQDPRFTSAINRNFRLNMTSPAVDRGQPSAVTDDLKGALRDLTPDLGAYELVP
jgi:hypothetical protein